MTALAYSQLVAAESYNRDEGRGVVRIDYESMDSLGASTGDVIEIRGKRKTVAKCLTLYPTDEGKGIIGMDAIVRKNADIALGDTVATRKIKSVPAAKLVIKPADGTPDISTRFIADVLENVPVSSGDNIMIPYFGSKLTCKVVGLVPVVKNHENAAMITEKTEVIATDKEFPSIQLGIKDTVKEEGRKGAFLVVRFHLSYLGSSEVAEYQKKLGNHANAEKLFSNYKYIAKSIVSEANNQLNNTFEPQYLEQINLAGVKFRILEQCSQQGNKNKKSSSRL